MLAATAVAMWISYLAVQRNGSSGRRRRPGTSGGGASPPRRRSACRPSARALTTAADPAQVADAVFAAMRDELRVDAPTFALLDERGRLRTLRRFGYDPDDPTDGVLAALQIDGPVLGRNVALLRRDPRRPAA